MGLVIILVGISGSGKSTLTKKLSDVNSVICSADDFFMVSGTYQFNYAELGNAHRQCFNKFRQAISNKTDRIIIDNTNLTNKERSGYIREALNNKYSALVVAISRPVDTCLSENVHGLTKEVLTRMATRKDLADGCYFPRLEEDGTIKYLRSTINLEALFLTKEDK